ncbi:formate C-acetyltransferase, partial [human gut metagenome]
ILTITSNVVYGKYTGAMPDGRPAGTPLSPGANPSYGAEQNGLLASLNSLTKLPYEWALDGISNTQTMNPDALGHNEDERVANLVNVMDGYFDQGAHHLNVNVFGKDKLSMLWSIQKSQSTLTSQFVYLDMLLSSSTLQRNSRWMLSAEHSTTECNHTNSIIA